MIFPEEKIPTLGLLAGSIIVYGAQFVFIAAVAVQFEFVSTDILETEAISAGIVTVKLIPPVRAIVCNADTETSHDLPVLYRGADGALASLHFDPSPAEALPLQTFANSYQLRANGEILELLHVAPAHTDSDIYVHFQKANVISMGDLFFNGMYPYIDPGTGGTITGMIGAADRILSLADNSTKIVAGHGPLGNKADLTKSRDMLITAPDRVQKLKSAGKLAGQAVAEKPFADLDPVWGKGIINSDQWVQIVYLTL